MAKLEHPPAFQFYPADFVSDGLVEAMTSEEVGAYILLLCKAWYESPVGSIPDDDRVLARWARLTPDAWQGCKAHVLAPFTLRTDGRWHQKRLRHCYDEQQRRKNERISSGKRGAAKRWHNKSSIAEPCLSYSSANAEPIANDSSSSSSSSSEDSSSKNLTPPNPPAGGMDDGESKATSGSRDKPKISGHDVELPESLQTPEFIKAWGEWCDERRDRKQPQTERGWKTSLADLARYGPAIAAEAIRRSIANNWRGLFPERVDGRTSTNVRGNGSLHGSPTRPDATRLLAQLAAEEAKAARDAGSGPEPDSGGAA